MPVVGRVSALCRYPVKSMQGQRLERATFGPKGVEGDRAFALRDEETGFIVSGKRPKWWGDMLRCSARSTDDGTMVELPDGATFPVGDPALAEALSKLFGRRVSVISEPPAKAAFQEVWERELKDGAPPYLGGSSKEVDGEETVLGGRFMAANGDFQNFGRVHLLSTGALQHLRTLDPESDFDARRYRSNVLVETEETGWVEDAWIGRVVTIGSVRFNVQGAVARCVMTTLPVGEDLPRDRTALRTLTRHHAVAPFEAALGDATKYPCVGVYAEVLEHGEIATGDSVLLED